VFLDISQQSRSWECGNPKGISKERGKGGKPASWLSMLSILCHFHGLLWKRALESRSYRQPRFPGNSGALRWLSLVLTVVLVQVAATIVAQAATEAGTLQRRYTDGTVPHYLMTGNNDGWQYTIQATDVVKRDIGRRRLSEPVESDSCNPILPLVFCGLTSFHGANRGG
jgi:hypothetical protein